MCSGGEYATPRRGCTGVWTDPRRQDAIVRSQMSVPHTLYTLLDLPI